jgi:exodeoxyribonuclease III
MKIATYNVNGVNGRLPVLLRWLKEARPDVVCLQELKAPQEKFPLSDIRRAGYGATWHGQKAWNGVAILARGIDPIETQRGLPGDPNDLHSRYIEATVADITVGCLYLPNGNPAPGPKFEYKLAWFERFHQYGKRLIASDSRQRGKSIPADGLSGIQTELSRPFGGLSAYNRAPAKDVWTERDGQQEDDIVVVEVMAKTLDES